MPGYGGADPLVRSRRPRRLLARAEILCVHYGRPTRASAADQGVRPTIPGKHSIAGIYRSLRIAGCCLHFRDLLIVPQVVQRNVNYPLVRAERVEDRERVLGGVFIERQVRLPDELQSL